MTSRVDVNPLSDHGLHAAAREPVGITQHRKSTPCADDD
jgi:hypothetical protein